MKQRPYLSLALLIFLAAPLFAQTPHHQTHFPPEEFQARWQKLFGQIGDRAVAIVQGVSLARGFNFPRQSNEFYYLSGIETPGAYLLLDGRTRKVTLFLPPRNERLERSEGKVLSAEDADPVRQLTGVDAVVSIKAMGEEWLAELMKAPAPAIYTLFSPAEGSAESRFELYNANAAIAADYWDGRLSREAHFVSLLRTRAPRAEVRDLTPILDEMRSVKSPREIALIRRASQLAGLGILEAIKSTRAGLYEYQLDATARYIFLAGGARLEGYRSITASGTTNIWNGHYYRNNAQLRDGDLVLMDFAPDYGYYTSDVTRMWPVNGKYSPVQRELLQFVLEYRNAVLKLIRPGVTTKAIYEQARIAMEPVLQRTKFSKPIYEQAARKMLATGGGTLSHPVGLAVHDDGPYNRDVLKVGHVFSIDPQLWVPEENLYIRYEDVIAVTENGYENFTEFLPTELGELEKLVGQGGIALKLQPPSEQELIKRK
ncbi:MAG TPA: Xaa-Pro aminopeptidase [Blastocatellia bacterium]|nr:Xaa-Pro aminopeptidase [Blastocatellia bacterium]HMY70912.1 Xaa-Pro aminopeptidase [Blastocatellia bacterium]HMZ21020.1 Xaa-Pro aminopeptidase [Blastocatellia bacterium]HNG29552.1 Xaa-Pro aminopeptidase [Blastocatellia bacterium]